MFCPKCGTENPETGKFCRSCGTDLGNLSDALSGRLKIEPGCGTTRRGRPITIESAATKFFMGLAFVVVAVALAFTGRGGNWWFWMLIPGFMFIGGGIAQYLQIRRFDAQRASFSSANSTPAVNAVRHDALPPQPAGFVPAAESRFKTGELVPPSVTETTTRHLDVNSEGETMTLPKR